MSTITTLEELFVEQLQDLYSAENQLIKALPAMAKAAHSPALKAGFEGHFIQTKEHAVRLKQIFAELGEKPPRTKSLPSSPKS